MKKRYIICFTVLILILAGCISCRSAMECASDPTESTVLSQTDLTQPLDEEVFREEEPEDPSTEPVSQTEPEEALETLPGHAQRPAETHPATPTKPAGNHSSGNATAPTEDERHAQTEPAKTQPTEPAETKPRPTAPAETAPQELPPPVTEPVETKPAETLPPVTEPEPTDPPKPEITYEFKRQVASYAAQYINQYRGTACMVLPGMSEVAQYRAKQLTRNYGHSTAAKRAALAHFEYGRYIDATEFGDDASNSYWEADSAEAICAGFYGTDPKAMGKKIADLIRNSSGHWSYISSSEYSYIGVGVEYREGSEYGWYACVMVGSVNYG